MKETSLEQVLSLLESEKDHLVLFTICERFNSHLNVLLLRHLIKDRGKKGVYLTVDRPSEIMKKLLQAKRIDLDKLIFLDPVSRISGFAPPPHGGSTRLIDNPFFGELLEQFNDEGHTRLRNEGVSFVMIDNLTSLSAYIDPDTMGALLVSLARWKDLTVFMCADERNPKVQEKARTACEKEVHFNEHMVPQVVSDR